MNEQREHEVSIRFYSSERMAQCVREGLLKSDWVRDMGFDDDQIRLDGPHISGEVKLAVLKKLIELLDDPTVEIELENKIGADWGRDKPYVYSNGIKITLESFTTRRIE